MGFEMIIMTKRQNSVVTINSLMKMLVQHSEVLRMTNWIPRWIRKGIGNKPESIILLHKAMYTYIFITALNLGWLYFHSSTYSFKKDSVKVEKFLRRITKIIRVKKYLLYDEQINWPGLFSLEKLDDGMGSVKAWMTWRRWIGNYCSLSLPVQQLVHQTTRQ